MTFNGVNMKDSSPASSNLSINWKIVRSTKELEDVTAGWLGPLIMDVETKGTLGEPGAELLGISMAPALLPSEGLQAIYVIGNVSIPHSFFNKLIGHNHNYDKQWIDSTFQCNSKWIADTRILWHLFDPDASHGSYNLKEAMVKVLGWPEPNTAKLKAEVEARGGKLKNGDHWMASQETLAEYACLDAFATAELYRKLSPWFDAHAYWDQLKISMQYSELLALNTKLGIKVDRGGLQKAHDRLLSKKEAAERRFRKLMKGPISELEEDWADRKAASYKREYNKIYYLEHPEKWKHFNLNSDADKRELFFDKLRLAVTETTEAGLPSASADAVKASGLNPKELEAYLTYEKSNTLTTNFSNAWLQSSSNNGRLHPGFNVCGTVSYRLSGFKPYLLNAPFDEKYLLRHFKVDEGMVGVHADLSAIEPTITAHFSDDAGLLKVFRDGLGDIYLDLALELFPADSGLQKGYNPLQPISSDIKKAFDKQRKIAKVIQLAVQYTGTKRTVAKNLTKQGISTTLEQADDYVKAYWRKFRAVGMMNYRLRELNRSQGFLRNAIGRIIRVPNPEYKDLSNRFIQSSAHDVLMLWVLEIYRLSKQRGIHIRPVLLDCHDSTSNCCPIDQAGALEQVYQEALANVQEKIGLSVTLKAETKRFTTLAGLKGTD